MDQSKDNSFLYAIKFIACLFVITIHARIPGVFGDVIFCLSRFAVPFFFAVSGRYLLVKRDGSVARTTDDIRTFTKVRLIKLLKITAIVFTSYLLFSLVFHLQKGMTALEWFFDKFNAFETRTFFVFNSGRYIYDDSYVFDHQWYLFALIYVYLLIIIFAPVLRKWYKGLIIILLLLLFFGELLQTIYPIRPFDISISTWYVLRNWLLVGMPFVLIGVVFSDKCIEMKDKLGTEDYDKYTKALLPKGVKILIIGIVMCLTEGHVMGSKEVYIGSVIMVFALLLISESGVSANGVLSFLGKRASSMIYFYHVMIIAILDIISINGLIPGYPMWLKPFLVMAISTIIFGLVPYLIEMVRMNEQK